MKNRERVCLSGLSIARTYLINGPSPLPKVPFDGSPGFSTIAFLSFRFRLYLVAH